MRFALHRDGVALDIGAGLGIGRYDWAFSEGPGSAWVSYDGWFATHDLLFAPEVSLLVTPRLLTRSSSTSDGATMLFLEARASAALGFAAGDGMDWSLTPWPEAYKQVALGLLVGVRWPTPSLPTP